MSTEPISFEGQVAVVTGAGNGLGRSYALSSEDVEANLGMVQDRGEFEVPQDSNDRCRIIAAHLPD